MAYTYNLTGTVRGGRRAVWDSEWDGSAAYAEQVAGIMGSAWYQSSMMFDTSSVAGKTITDVKLTFAVASGTIPSSGTQNLPICNKADSSTASWKRSSTTAVGYIANQTSGGGTITANNTPITISLGTTLPTYGYVAGPRASSYSSSYKYVKLASTATLAVTTNETYRTYTLTYDANGGKGAPSASSVGNIQVNPSCSFTVSSTKPTRDSVAAGSYTVSYSGAGSLSNSTAARTTSYTFSSWNTNSSGTGTNYASGSTFTSTSTSNTLYAKWSASTSTASVTLPNPTMTGYSFNGWWTANTGGTKVGNGGAAYTPTGNVTLYARWTPNTYTVSYNMNGGTGSIASQTKTYGVNLTLSSTKPTRSSTSAGSYTVTYNANGGTVGSASASATRTTSYAFSKWNTASNGSGTSYESGGTYATNAAATLYAQWNSSTTTASVTLPTPTRTNYYFNGWYTAATGGSKAGNAGASYTPSGNITLYAQWTAAAATLSTVYAQGTTSSEVFCGNNVTATWTSTGASYKYKITITCGNATATSSSQTSAGAQTASVQVPTTWYSMANGPLRDSMSATATCTLTTYDGGGTAMATTSSKTFTVKVPTSVVPTVGALTATSDSLNGTVAGWGADVFVQGYSFVKKLQLAVSDHGAGAVLKSVVFSGPGMSENSVTSGSSPYSSASGSVVSSAGNQKYTAVYTNSRGQSVTKTLDINFQAYSKPTITRIDVARCDSNGDTNNGSGQYIKATPVYYVSSIKNSNNVEKNPISSQTIAYKLHTAGAYGAAETCASSTMSGPWSAVTTAAYDVKVTVGDQLFSGASASSAETTIPSVQGIWYGKGNDRLGLGGVPTGPGLHVDWNAEFNGVVDVTQRRCYATIPANSIGWYRIIQYNAIGNAEAIGDYGRIFNIRLVRRYNDGNNEVHKITLMNPYNVFKFTDETSVSNGLFFTKVRATYNSTTHTTNIDVYYDSTRSNNVAAFFDVCSAEPEAQKRAVSVPFTNVSAAPSGETILPEWEYTFAANTITDVSSAFSFNTSKFSGLTGRIYALYNARDKTVELNVAFDSPNTIIGGGSTNVFITCSNSRYAPKTGRYYPATYVISYNPDYTYFGQYLYITTTGNVYQSDTNALKRCAFHVTYEVN